jgi:hypothetical protein
LTTPEAASALAAAGLQLQAEPSALLALLPARRPAFHAEARSAIVVTAEAAGCALASAAAVAVAGAAAATGRDLILVLIDGPAGREALADHPALGRAALVLDEGGSSDARCRCIGATRRAGAALRLHTDGPATELDVNCLRCQSSSAGFVSLGGRSVASVSASRELLSRRACNSGLSCLPRASAAASDEMARWLRPDTSRPARNA